MGKQLYPVVPVPPAPSAPEDSTFRTWTESVTEELNSLQQNVFDSRDFNLKGDGTEEDSNAMQGWLDSLTEGGVGQLSQGTYLLTSESVLTGTTRPVEILAYGATIQTSGIEAGLHIRGKDSTTAPVTVSGLQIDHAGNSDASYGINVDGAWNVRLQDCVVRADSGVATDYAAFRVGQLDTDDQTTGAFWCKIRDAWVRVESGGAAGDIPYGILLEGSANAATVEGGGLNSCDTGIAIRDQSSNSYVPNSVQIENVAFEGCNTGVHVSSTSIHSNLAGLRSFGNRFESVQTCYVFDGITRNPSYPPYIAGDMMVSDISSDLSNPNNLDISYWNFGITPSTSSAILHRGITIKPEGATEWPITIHSVGGGRGIAIMDGTGATQHGVFAWTGTGSNCRVQSADTLELYGDNVLKAYAYDKRFVVSGATLGINATHTPASGTADGVTGDVCWDASYIYVCESAASWRRATLATF